VFDVGRKKGGFGGFKDLRNQLGLRLAYINV